MTIEEAVDILANKGLMTAQYFPGKYQKAVRLGIEALKEIPRYRRIVYPDMAKLLPGETKD